MIREYKEEDKSSIIDLLNLEFEKEAIDEIIGFSHESMFYVYDQDNIKGFGYVKQYDNIENNWHLFIFMHPNYRKNGLGYAIYHTLLAYLNGKNPNKIRSIIDIDREDGVKFLKNQGFKKWYGTLTLIYEGPRFDDIELNVRPVEEQYFDTYFKLCQEAFYEVRKNGGIEPYLIPDTKEYRDYKLNQREKIHFVFEKSELIGAFMINKDTIDEIFVSPKYQGKGYGKKLIKYIINEILKNHSKVILSVLDNNYRAVRFYKSVGFKFHEHQDVYII